MGSQYSLATRQLAATLAAQVCSGKGPDALMLLSYISFFQTYLDGGEQAVVQELRRSRAQEANHA